MTYVDGFVLPVPVDKLPAYRRPRIQDMFDNKAMPFDGKRMFWGGFKTFLSL
jgi:uncharacterized protein YbaA (DUF1428 family)